MASGHMARLQTRCPARDFGFCGPCGDCPWARVSGPTPPREESAKLQPEGGAGKGLPEAELRSQEPKGQKSVPQEQGAGH